MTKEKTVSIWDPRIVTRAIGDSFRKLESHHYDEEPGDVRC